MTELKFSELGLTKPIQRALTERNYVTPTPIQAQAIPLLLDGNDMMGIAQTGTGKTAAFSLPMLQKLAATPGKNAHNSPRALIMAPTRELAIQIADEVRTYGKFLHLRQTVIFGGVSQKAQVNAISRGVEILIATPGRLLDLMNQKRLKLDAVEFLVLDEADRMFDMGFINDVRKIIAALPKSRQSLLFSATMANEMERLSREVLTDHVLVEVAPKATPIERIQQNVYHVKANDKTGLLSTILEDPALSRVIVFSRTKHRANRIAEQLCKQGVEADAIHGNKSQGARQRALKQFRSGKVRVLVATDIAARGIDIDGVTHVINFELPNESDSYVHRIGRTARAGATGVAISFCDSTERAYLRDIESLIKQEITVIGEKPPEEEFGAYKKPQARRPWKGKSPVKSTGKKGGQDGRSKDKKRAPTEKPRSQDSRGKPWNKRGRPQQDSSNRKPGGNPQRQRKQAA